MLSLTRELFAYMGARKKWWLLPVLIVASQDPAVLEACWPVFQRLNHRKKLGYRRPLSMWTDLMTRAAPVSGLRMYTASLDGEVVQAILLLRDAVCARYILGALDVDKVRGKASPSCLLHWHAMRDCRGLGCRLYDLGPPSGPVYQFKRKFHPVSRPSLPMVHVTTRSGFYYAWSNWMLPAAIKLWPQMQRLAVQVLRRAEAPGS